MSQDVLLIVMNSRSLNGKSMNMDRKRNESCDKCFNLESELLKSQNAFNDLLKSYLQLEKHCITLELSIQLNQEIFQKDESSQIQDKVFVITSLKNDLRKLKGKEIVDIGAQIPSANTIVPGMFKLDLDPLAPRLFQNRKAQSKQPLDNALDFACKHAQQIQELLVVQIVLSYLDSGCSKHITGNRFQLINFVSKFLASKTKSWLWHRRLSHLNFGNLNKLTKDGLVRGIPRLKFQKDHLGSACALGKIKKSSHQPKAEDTNQEKPYLLHMDLCGRITKDEAPEAIIKCIKNIQAHLNVTIRNVRTDNRTKIFNQTLREFYENVSISHQTSVARTPQQNGVVERQNQTLVEAARI
ncbi:retrovirus-related pol polyprotein from transposon TNT 1-94, partial [Tanacetum coccineum]